MKKKLKKVVVFALILSIGVIAGIFIRHDQSTWLLINKPFVKLNAIQQDNWSEDFSLVAIKSTIDSNIQKM
jgi:hypothetical protein